MSAIVDREFDRNLRPRERHRGFPKLALRQRSAEHPMIMFFLAVAAGFTAMAVVPPTGAAFATFESPLGSRTASSEAPGNIGLSGIEIACHGQAWGGESAECLAMIARDSGRTGGRKVRVVAGA